MKNRYIIIIAAQFILILLLTGFSYFQKVEADRQREIVTLTERITEQLQRRLIDCVK